MVAVSIRLGDVNDLIACTEVWRSTVDDRLDPPTAGYPLYAHEARTGTLIVAEREGRICGFGGSVTRAGRWFLADLFVSPPLHGSGVGRRLVNALIDIDQPGPDRVTMASSDPRALTLYTQLGMTPRWPCFSLTGPAAPVEVLSRSASVVEECDPDALLRLADECGYPLHPDDLAYWLAETPAECLRIRSGGDAVAGGVVRWGTPFAISDPTAITLGPVFAARPTVMLDAMAVLLGCVTPRASGRTLRCYVPGPNAVLEPLLDAGFRIDDFDLFCSARPDGLDPALVLPSHDLL